MRFQLLLILIAQFGCIVFADDTGEASQETTRCQGVLWLKSILEVRGLAVSCLF